MTFWLNGAFHEDPRAISIADRGLLLGDGLFETILVLNGTPVFFGRHLERMRSSAKALGFDQTIDDGALRQAVTELAVQNNAADAKAVARLTLTRGPGGRGLDAPRSSDARSTLLLTVNAWRPPAKAAAKLIVSKYRRAEHSVSTAHKTLGYLDNIMARAEAEDVGAQDAVMLNSAGRAACASAANLFLITGDGVVVTPPVSEGALPGVVRQVLLEEAPKAGVAIAETPIEAGAVESAPLFLTNSLTGLRPAVLTGGDGGRNAKAANILERLQSCYGGAVRREINGG